MSRAQGTGTGTISGRVKNLVSDSYLNNARVSIKGTDQVELTDDAGSYRFTNVPAGPVTLRFFFTGLDEEEATVNVVAGQTVEQNMALTNKSLYGSSPDTVKLDAFVVQSSRETNAAAIAVNEQRISPNIKSVISTDAYGPMANHNVGEFLKYLPGVGVEYFANNITGVNVRGLGSINTEITYDGLRQASSFTESTDRGFQMKATSIADIQRVEIRKVPLPEDSANAIGGAINLVRRSAFEYDHPVTNYQAYFTSDGEVLTTAQRDGPKDRHEQYWRPNFEIDYTNPITKNFGISIAASHDDKIVRTHWSQPSWNFGSTSSDLAYEAAKAAGGPLPTVPSVYNPARTSQLLHDAPIKDSTDELSLSADWRPTDELTLGYNIQKTFYYNQTADDVRYTWSTGTATYADQYTTLGTAGAGSAKFNTPLWRDQYEPQISNTIKAKWRHNDWSANMQASYSYASHSFADMKDGFFNSTTSGTSGLFPDTGIGTGTANPIPLTVNFKNMTDKMPQTIEAFDASGNPVDWSSAANLKIGGARSKPSKDYTTLVPVKLSIKRDFDTRFGSGYLMLGFNFTDEYRNKQRYDNNNWAFVGADHVASTADDSADQIAATSLRPDRDSIYNSPSLDHISLSRLYRLYQLHPDWFVYKDVDSFKLSAAQPFEYNEATYAPYIQGEIKLLHNRLDLTGGLRFERATVTGRGFLNNPEAAYQKYADGTTPMNTADLLNPDGTPQRYADGTVKRTGDTVNATTGLPTKHAAGTFVYLPGVTKGSMAEAVLTNVRKGAYGSGANQNTFPSLHGTYKITDNLLLKMAFAKTQAKNRFDRSVIPNTTISDSTDTSVSAPNLGSISLRNPRLVPWVGYNYEADLEYYTKSGGSFAIDGYMKSIHHYQVNPHIFLDSPDTAAQFGLGPEWVNYTVSTWINTGSVKIVGGEASAQQSLDPVLPGWARGFSVSASYNYNNLKGDVPTSNGDFGNMNNDRETVYLKYGRRRFEAGVGVIRNGTIWVQTENIGSPGNPGYYPGTRKYIPSTMLDASVVIGLTKWTSLYIAGNNLTGARKTRERVIQGAPSWSYLQIENTLGTTYSIGVTGSF